MLEDRYKHNITNIMNSITVLTAAKKGVFSPLMDFFHRSEKVDDAQSNVDVLSFSEVVSDVAKVIPQPSALAPKPAAQASGVGVTPIMGPVKPKPVPVPDESECSGEHKYSQPEAIDCRTRLIALAPQDGGAFFNELSDKYSTLSNSTMPEVVAIVRNDPGVDYIDLIQKACSNDKSINLDSFSKLLGLHAVMIEAGCFDWIDDMNLLRKGFGDAVLATVASKYSVDECREILGDVYRSTAA